MALRFALRRSGALSENLGLLPKGRGFATAAAKVEADDSVNVRKGTSQDASASQQASKVRLPFGMFNVFPPLGRGTSLLQMMDTMEDLFNNSSAVNPTAASRVFRNSNRTPWDVMEDSKAFKLRLDMPGLSKDEVSVDIVEGNLSVKGEHKPVEGEDDWSERSCGSYNIKIKLPENIKVDAIKAELKNGVLRVVAPKVEEVRKRVEVKVN